MEFAIYSIDNLDPNLASNVTKWQFDKFTGRGEFDKRHEWEGRGVAVPTFGGVLVQDYGMHIEDRKIRVAGEEMTEAIREALQTKFETLDQDWNFTDGLEVFRVRFRRNPRGFMAQLQGARYGQGFRGFPDSDVSEFFQSQQLYPSKFVYFTYELVLLVRSQLV
jgi:hypothetical protein